MSAIPLRRLVDREHITMLLQAFAAIPEPAVKLGLAGADGRWFAAYPEPPEGETLVREVCETRQAVSSEDACALPIVAEHQFCAVLYCCPSDEHITQALLQTLEALFVGALTRKSLARETLDRYREINLLYRLHETIGSTLDLDKVITRVLEESIRVIKAEGGSVLLKDELTDQLVHQDSVRLDVAGSEKALIDQALSDRVCGTAKPRILNHLDSYVRLENAQDAQLVSLLCAPLKSAETTLGVITLGKTRSGTMFTAGDEKLLMALASQAGIAIANARTVKAREQRLQQQIRELKIEIDESRKQHEVHTITESEFFARLQKNAKEMRDEFRL